MTDEETVLLDWRGVPITIGATVIYGSGVGRSIQMNEAEVVGYGPDKGINSRTGKPELRTVQLRVIRRSYSSGIKEVVSVGQDRLTIVKELAPTTLLTQAEENAEQEARYQLRIRNQESHTLPTPTMERPEFPSRRSDTWPYRFSDNQEWQKILEQYHAAQAAYDKNQRPDCSVCGLSWRDQMDKECTNNKEES